jgi:Reverse transcriptase (RNA-dependent DNA polymerase)
VENTDFKLWYTEKERSRNDVGILIDKSLKNEVVAVRRQGDRIIMIKLIFGDLVLNVIKLIRACDGESNTFSIKIGLHQGSALSPYIFTLVMDEITKDIQEDIPWCMLFADDVVLIDENKLESIKN